MTAATTGPPFRVAILAPVAWRCPPRHYGPWEQVAALLADGLVARGVDVTLFATLDSLTEARLDGVLPHGYAQDPDLDGRVSEALHIAHAFGRSAEFDLVHSHLDWLPLAFEAFCAAPLITTVHGFGGPAVVAPYRASRSTLVSISDSDRRPDLHYAATVHHGVDERVLPLSTTAGQDLVVLGRIHPDKGTAEAIDIARAAGRRLVICGIVHDARYFRELVEPRVDGDRVRYLGTVGPRQRAEVLGAAAALLHPISFDEPFGLSVVEAMMCGTPVVAFRRGSMPEIVDDGVSGFVVDDVPEALAAVEKAVALDRRTVHDRAMARFGAARMVDDYLGVYRKVLAGPAPSFPADPARRSARRALRSAPIPGKAMTGFGRTRYAMLSTFPPTQCGLATFARALADGLCDIGAEIDIVRVVPTEQPPVERVVAQWSTDPDACPAPTDPAGLLATAAVLNRYDAVVLQHEYGIYSGPDGEDLVSLLRHLTVPVVSVLHTVLRLPTEHQHRVLSEVVRHSATVVTMTQTARQRAVELYGAAPDRAVVIPHGAADRLVTERPLTAQHLPHDEAPVILTWGLLGRGKGIEWAIHAMAQLTDLRPAPVYVVAGRTHPRLSQRDGAGYRDELVRLAAELGVSAVIDFHDGYLAPDTLHQLVHSADLILLPYDSVEQVTSGVLTEAVAAGKPVISTRFPHAVELLGEGTGLLVDREDPAAIAAAVRSVLTDRGLARDLARRARRVGEGLGWRDVAGAYLAVCDRVSRRRIDPLRIDPLRIGLRHLGRAHPADRSAAG